MKTIHFIIFLLAPLLLNRCQDGGLSDPCLNCPSDFRLTDFEPAWSPDGSTIAYVHGDTAPGMTGIYLINPNGTNKRLWYASVGAGSPTWSPDGQWIAFHENAQIYKRNLAGDSLVQLTFEGRNFFPAWSPDGGWTAFSSTTGTPVGVWVSPTDGSGERIYFAFGGQPDWFPDGQRLSYGNRGVWIERFDRSSKAQVYGDTLNRLGSFKVSPNGLEIAFTLQPEGGVPQIWVVSTDGSYLIQLTTEQGYTCDWSQDGEWIVYTDSRAAEGLLWVMRKDGSEKRRLTSE